MSWVTLMVLDGADISLFLQSAVRRCPKRNKWGRTQWFEPTERLEFAPNFDAERQTHEETAYILLAYKESGKKNVAVIAGFVAAGPVALWKWFVQANTGGRSAIAPFERRQNS